MPQTPLGELPQTPELDLRGPTSKGKEGIRKKERGGRGKGDRDGKESLGGRGGEGKFRGGAGPQIFFPRTAPDRLLVLIVLSKLDRGIQ